MWDVTQWATQAVSVSSSTPPVNISTQNAKEQGLSAFLHTTLENETPLSFFLQEEEECCPEEKAGEQEFFLRPIASWKRMTQSAT